MLIFKIAADVDMSCNVQVHTASKDAYVVGQIRRVIGEIENSTADHDLAVGIDKAFIVADIADAELVGSLVKLIVPRGIYLSDIPFDTPMLRKVKGRIKGATVVSVATIMRSAGDSQANLKVGLPHTGCSCLA